MASYKIIDGVVYQAIDTSEIKHKLDALVEKVRPYKEGIKQCDAKILEYQTQKDEYERQIAKIIEDSAIEQEVAQALDPDKANFLGL